ADQWRRLIMRLEKEDGGYVDIDLLRPLDWIEAYNVEVGGLLDLDNTELEATGVAKVLMIEPCPPISEPPSENCRVVTGRYVHSPSPILDLQIAAANNGLPDVSIGVTPNHPIWSHDRREYVPAGELRIGEQLVDAYGNVTHVTTIVPRAGPQPVYNLEVDVEHVYYVSQAGILVHNATVTCGPHGNSKSSTKP